MTRLAPKQSLFIMKSITSLILFITLFLFSLVAWGHDISTANAQFVQSFQGVATVPFLYLGAKHMLTGYDHLLFLLGIIFFLYRPKDIIFYITLFTTGHSITLLLGVFMSWQVNSYLVDAIIGLSIVYKALENMQAFEKWFNCTPNTGIAVFIFGLFHGLGLATKLQEYIQTGDGLVSNLISFNIGIELGQLLALIIILAALVLWRRHPSFKAQSFTVNIMLMTSGFIFFGIQTAGYFLSAK